jgi:YhcH/YjgK/YiaL family protein
MRMIIGNIDNWQNMQLKGPHWARAFEVLQSLRPDSEETKTGLLDDRMYMLVMSYATKMPESDDAVLEAHRRYVDIQTVITGSERIDWFPRAELAVAKPYDPEKDVEFYRRPGLAPAGVDVIAGRFAVLFPEDAHMPQLVTANGDGHVKKAVIKLALSLLEEG